MIMKIYETVNDYLLNRKVGDRIVLGGKGLIDGVKNIGSKWDVEKVHKYSTGTELKFTRFGGRTVFGIYADAYDQKVAVLSEEEFNNLPK